MKKVLLLTVLVTALFTTTTMAQDALLGEVKLFAGNFAPRGWAFCDGQMLNISDYSALFSILGTTYGGDGRTTFALPDMRGHVAIGAGMTNGNNTLTPGREVNVGKDGDSSVKGLGMHYIICTSGLFPSRN